MAQQQGQFQDELALRRSGQDQTGQYQNMLMALKQREFDNQLSGFTPRDVADNQFRYEQLANQLKIAELNAKAQDPRLQVERERQDAILRREQSAALEDWEYNKVAAENKANQYNSLLNAIEEEAKKKEARQSWGFDDPESRKLEADKHRQTSIKELLQQLPLDRRPGDIHYNPVTKKFESLLPRRPSIYGTQPLPGLGGAPWNPVQQPGVGQPPPQIQTGVAQPQPAAAQQPQTGQPSANTPIKIRTSDGKIWDTTSGMWSNFKRRDPGAQIITPQGVRPDRQTDPTTGQSNVNLLRWLYGFGR
jgi:hypothetical protein